MENNQNPIDIYIDDFHEQGHFPSIQQYYQPQERNPPQVENYPVMQAATSYATAVPSIVNQEVTDLTQPLLTNSVVIVDRPPNYFPLALITCLCCCWPISISAIVKSKEVDSAYAAGDMYRAQNASFAARQYSLISLTVGIVWNVILVLFFILYYVFFIKY